MKDEGGAVSPTLSVLSLSVFFARFVVFAVVDRDAGKRSGVRVDVRKARSLSASSAMEALVEMESALAADSPLGEIPDKTNAPQYKMRGVSLVRRF